MVCEEVRLTVWLVGVFRVPRTRAPAGPERVSVLVEGPALSGSAACGFTLVEVLLVVAVLGLLVMLVVPTLQRAREHGYDAVCKSNLGQLWTFLQAGEGLVPPAPAGWVGLVEAKGGGDVLKCPKADVKTGGGVVSVGGGFAEIAPPGSEVFDSLESNSKVFLWLERRSFALPTAVKVNLSAPGRYSETSRWTPKTIPAGTVVDVYMTHFDPVGSGPAETSGVVTFGGQILGLICLEGELLASDPVFGIPQTQYDPGHWGARGFESGQEVVSLSDDMQTWTIDYYYSTFPGEDVRILTAPGGAASYGMNNRVQSYTRRPGQLLLVEYRKIIVDLDGEGYDDEFSELIAPRHLDKCNTLFVDGSVKGLPVERLTPDQDVWRP